jgi:hypothetical protein
MQPIVPGADRSGKSQTNAVPFGNLASFLLEALPGAIGMEPITIWSARHTDLADVEEDILLLGRAARRLRFVAWTLLALAGPPTLFLFLGTIIALAVGQAVALRAIILFPLLAGMVFGIGIAFLRLAEGVESCQRPALIVSIVVSLSTAAFAAVLSVLDVWLHCIAPVPFLVKIATVAMDLMSLSLLIEAIDAARRIEAWETETHPTAQVRPGSSLRCKAR